MIACYDTPWSYPVAPSTEVDPFLAVPAKIQRPPWYKYMDMKAWNEWRMEQSGGVNVALSFLGCAAFFLLPCAILLGCLHEFGENVGPWIGFPLAGAFCVWMLVKCDN
jgi:hypothetical protein